jgi:hypothetical protein
MTHSTTAQRRKTYRKEIGERRMTGFHTYRVARPTGAAAIALLVAGLVGKPAQAVEFDIDGWTGSVDTALV